jgi:LmbE family N-acetylglucosaminyl deacetylase
MSAPDHHSLITPLERVLVVVSHPDDAEFGAAATIAALTRAGARVDYVVTTDGGKGTDDPAVRPEQLAATRIAEQRAAADVLGVSEITHLGYPDGYLTPSLELRRDITRQIRRYRPDLVITQNPQRRLDHNPFIGHPDHLATGEATLASVYPAARDRLNVPEPVDAGLEPWKVRFSLPGRRRRSGSTVDQRPPPRRAIPARSRGMPARDRSPAAPPSPGPAPGPASPRPGRRSG